MSFIFHYSYSSPCSVFPPLFLFLSLALVLSLALSLSLALFLALALVVYLALILYFALILFFARILPLALCLSISHHIWPFLPLSSYPDFRAALSPPTSLCLSHPSLHTISLFLYLSPSLSQAV